MDDGGGAGGVAAVAGHPTCALAIAWATSCHEHGKDGATSPRIPSARLAALAHNLGIQAELGLGCQLLLL